MIETAEQYIARMKGFLGDRDPRAVMAETPARLQSLVAGATPAQLTWTSSPSRWSITQIVAHLADAEIVGAWRFRLVLGQDQVPLQAYDQNEWESSFHYEQVPPAESLALFAALRGATLRILRVVDPKRQQHVGLHAERGPESIHQLTVIYAGHDLNHISQIEKLLEESRGRG